MPVYRVICWDPDADPPLVDCLENQVDLSIDSPDAAIAWAKTITPSCPMYYADIVDDGWADRAKAAGFLDREETTR